MHEIQQILEGIGFHEKEALVYLACLELDGAANTEIAKKTKLNRITNYEILKRLQNKGVVTSFKKRNGKHFVAIDPRIVLKQHKEKLALLEESLPELLSFTNTLPHKPKIYFLEGIDGIKKIYDDSLQARKEILTYTNPEDIRKLLGDTYIDKYVQERVKRNIRVRGFAPDDTSGQAEQKVAPSVLRQVKLFSRDRYPIHNEIMIYNDRIALFSGKDRMGLIIENESLANTFRSIWEMQWNKE